MAERGGVLGGTKSDGGTPKDHVDEGGPYRKEGRHTFLQSGRNSDS